MNRRRISVQAWGLVVGMITAMACQSSEPPVLVAAEDERPTRVETVWTESHEWFVEHPLLVQGESAEFAAHLTSLEDFRAIELGSLEVTLLDSLGAQRQQVVAETVARPGIFLPQIMPDWSGNGRLVLTYRAPTGATDQVAWDVRVAGIPADLGVPPPEPEGIGFLKEQQWRIPFATLAAGSSTIRDTIVLPATIESHERFTAAVVPPGPGIFRAPDTGLPGPGTSVRSGQVLGHLWPAPGVADDWSSLGSEFVRARNDATEAAHEHDRAERLVAAGAIPGRRLVEARTALEDAQARLQSVAARVAVLEGLGVGPSDSVALPLVAPMSGVVARVAVTDGEPVDAEHALFRILDLDRLVARVEVPEPALVRLLAAFSEGSSLQALVRPGGARGAGSGRDDWITAGRLLDLGTEVDPTTRTAPLRYELRGAGDRLRPGMSAEAQLQVGDTRQALTVPAQALIDLAGVSVLYVQLGGETFEERVVRTGVLDGDVIEIVSGLRPGDRVVTVGAYQVRLAALSPDAAPAHSH